MNSVPIVNWDYIANWKPRHGDWIIYNGFFSQWCGVIIGVDAEYVSVRYDGLMILLVQGTKEKIRKININSIKYSKGGKYTILRHLSNAAMPLWFLA
jgi:hypothetical protein